MELVEFIKSLRLTYTGGFVILDLVAWYALTGLIIYEIYRKFNNKKIKEK